MKNIPKLLLYSLSITEKHFAALEKLCGKKATGIDVACIENATDVIEGAEYWVPGMRQPLIGRGYQVETIDLRKWLQQTEALFEKLQSKDVIWLCGGHTYYLRWILKESGADNIIKQLVAEGKIYAGWSAGAIMAGPTTRFFNLMGDDPADAPERIDEGLNLTNTVIVPHMDNTDFAAGATHANEALKNAGYQTVPLNDDQACIIIGNELTVL